MYNNVFIDLGSSKTAIKNKNSSVSISLVFIVVLYVAFIIANSFHCQTLLLACWENVNREEGNARPHKSHLFFQSKIEKKDTHLVHHEITSRSPFYPLLFVVFLLLSLVLSTCLVFFLQILGSMIIHIFIARWSASRQDCELVCEWERGKELVLLYYVCRAELTWLDYWQKRRK